MQLVVNFGIPYSKDYYTKWGSILTIIFSAMPWSPFAKAINDLGNATLQDSSPGLKWADRYSYCNVRLSTAFALIPPRRNAGRHRATVEPLYTGQISSARTVKVPATGFAIPVSYCTGQFLLCNR